MRKTRGASRSGFTLIEITFAILILAGSLVVLLGLQSAAVRRQVSDRNGQRAMLAARQILAAIESSRDLPENQDTEGTAQKILDLVMKVPSDAVQDSELSTISAGLRVEDWGLPGLQDALKENAMKRIMLRVWWSDSPLDMITIVYFTPFDLENDD